MEKIVLNKLGFVNGQAPAVNDDNLNKMQDNTETAINELVPPITALEKATEELQNNQNTEKDSLEETKRFIEGCMQTLEAEGTNIHVTDSAEHKCKLEVYGKSEQKARSGKNLFDLSKVTTGGRVSKTETGVILDRCWATSPYSAENTSKMLKANTTYTMYAKAKVLERPATMTASNNNLFMLYKSADPNILLPCLTMNDKWTTPIGQEKTYVTSFTTPEDITGASIVSYTFHGNNTGETTGEATGKIEISDIMLVEGSYTEETFPPYEEYGVMPSPNYPSEITNVEVGLVLRLTAKNILPRTFAQDLLNRLNVSSSNTVNCITTINGSTYFKYKCDLGYKTGEDKIYFIKNRFKENTRYVFKTMVMKNNSEENYRANIIIKYKDGTNQVCNLDNTWANMTEKELIVITETGKTVTEIGISYNSGITYINLDKYILCEYTEGMNTAELQYEPYTEQTITFPLSENQKMMEGSYLADDGIHHKRKSYVFTGSETIKLYTYGTAHTKTIMFEIQKIIPAKMNIIKFCNYFTVRENKVETLNTDENWILNNALGSVYICIEKSIAGTADEFKAWLAEQYAAGTPVIIEYGLATEETVPYTATQATAWQQIDALKTNQTTTNITNNQNTKMKLTYKKDLQTQIAENEALKTRIAALEALHTASTNESGV